MTNMDGQTLRQFRTKRGITQLQLAEAAKLALNTVNECEAGRRELRSDNARKLCSALGVTVTYTMGDLVVTQPPA